MEVEEEAMEVEVTVLTVVSTEVVAVLAITAVRLTEDQLTARHLTVITNSSNRIITAATIHRHQPADTVPVATDQVVTATHRITAK